MTAPGRKRKRTRWIVVAVVVVVLAVALWFGGDWVWHFFLRMHGIRGRHS